MAPHVAGRRATLLVTTHSISRAILQRTASLFAERADLDRLPPSSSAVAPLRQAFRDRFVRTGLALSGHAAVELLAEPQRSPLVIALRDLHDEVSSPSNHRPHVRDQILIWQALVFTFHDRYGDRRVLFADGRLHDEALFVPPPFDQVQAQLDALDSWLREPVDGPAVALLVAGVALHTVMHLQPLSSHNDLAATLLALDHMSRAGSNPLGVLSLEPLWSDPRRLYRAVDAGMWSGDLTGWLELFLEVVLTETRMHAAEARAALRREAAATPAPAVTLNDRQRRALEIVRQQGRITNRDYRRLLGVSNKTAHQELRNMVERKVIRRVGFGRGVVYV
jgi:hypothetical protein